VSLFDELRAVVESGERAVVFTVVRGVGIGAKLLVREDGSTAGDASEELAGLAPDALRRGHSHVVEHDGLTLFADVFGPPPRLLVYGAVDTSEALCRAAKLLGWHTIVADARARFATKERVPSADELVVAWPDEIEIDEETALVSLVHEERLDVPALRAGVEGGAFYVGALGSKRAQEKRREKLGDVADRVRGPVGLDLGGVTPAEIALEIVGEILSVLRRS
jgi:xanthine dehydrogenase accessory factor